MNVVIHLYVCLFVFRRMEEKLCLYETPMYFGYFVHFHVVYDIFLFGDNLHQSFNFSKDILNIYQNSPKSFFLFIYMGSSIWFCIIW